MPAERRAWGEEPACNVELETTALTRRSNPFRGSEVHETPVAPTGSYAGAAL